MNLIQHTMAVFSLTGVLGLGGCNARETFEPAGVLSTEACQSARADALSRCVEPSTHVRAGCFKGAHEDFAGCLSMMGEEAQAVIEVCRAECVFLHVTCAEYEKASPSLGLDCQNELETCESDCENPQPSR